jgi:hypothetical protein
MRNEALETHSVRHVNLIATATVEGHETVPTADGRLLSLRNPRGPVRCRAGTVDCAEAVMSRDDVEYASTTDDRDLAAREEVILEFDTISGDVALVLSARNSFVTTYVFYQALAYAGMQTGELLAALERGQTGAEDRVLGVQRALGGIEVLVLSTDGDWKVAGEFDEAGPIAADRQVIQLGTVAPGPIAVKLRMAKGSWRIDEALLANVSGEVRSVTLTPDSVTAPPSGVGARDSNALDRLADPSRYLVTVPGDAYRIWFTVPEGGAHDLFLDSQGYYYEWMRHEWLADESAAATAALLFSPERALEAMAPGFKALEPRFEHLFWASRFRR